MSNYILAIITGMLLSTILLLQGFVTKILSPVMTILAVDTIAVLLTGGALLIRPKLFRKIDIKWYQLLGGVVGAFSIVLNLLSYQKIGIASAIGLSFFGQTITSILIDYFGILNHPKQTLNLKQTLGLCLMVVGTLLMIKDGEVVPALMSFSSGFLIVLKRLFNGDLSKKASNVQSLFYYFVVSSIALLAFSLVTGDFSIPDLDNKTLLIIPIISCIAFICNIFQNNLVKSSDMFIVTTLIFVANLFWGYFLDFVFLDKFYLTNFIGGIIICIGIYLKQVAAHPHQDKNKTPA